MELRMTAIFMLVILQTSSHAEARKVKLRNNAKAMKEEVLKRIPIGSSIHEAKRLMEKSGFKCEMEWNESFGDYDDKGNQVTRKGMDFLYCDKEKKVLLFPIFLRRWQICIVHKEGVVSEVYVSIRLTGP